MDYDSIVRQLELHNNIVEQIDDNQIKVIDVEYNLVTNDWHDNILTIQDNYITVQTIDKYDNVLEEYEEKNIFTYLGY